MTDQLSVDDLIKIAEQREEWAKAARDKDLHGSAKEWELTASLARRLAAALNALKEAVFLLRAIQ